MVQPVEAKSVTTGGNERVVEASSEDFDLGNNLQQITP